MFQQDVKFLLPMITGMRDCLAATRTSEAQDGSTSSILLLTNTRIPNILGEATLHYEPVLPKLSSVPKAGAFEFILGLTSVPETKEAQTASTRQLNIRLEYDDAIIANNTATAYLEQLRNYIESPGDLLL